MKTAEEWAEEIQEACEYGASVSDIIQILAEHDAEIVKMIDGDIKFAESKLENKDLSTAMQNYYKGQINVLTELREKIYKANQLNKGNFE